MSAKNWQISRRTMLKGVGAALSLPWLEAMSPLASFGQTTSAEAPVRMAVLYMPNGVNGHHWTPTARGKNFELTPILSPLAKVKDDLLVLTELWNANTETGDGHYVKTGGFLTGTTITRTTGSDVCSGGISMDQIAAARIGNLTPLPSIELGIEATWTFVDTQVGFTTLYGGHIAWNTPHTPLAKEIDPRLAFDRLFRTSAPGNTVNAAENQSVIDLVLDDAKRLQRKVGRADQTKLDEYLDSVRSVERRIEFDRKRVLGEYRATPLLAQEMDKYRSRLKAYHAAPEQEERDHTEHVRLMLDLMVLAFWSDSTRVGTFMFGNAVSGRNFSFLDGVKGGHHEISHHQDDAKKLEEYKLINTWHIAQYAYMLERMKSIREGDRTLLDNSMILFGAGMRDGNEHNPHNLPLVLAGKGGDTIATGRHLVYEKKTPLCNLYRSMLNRMGAPVKNFADSTGELAGLNDATFTGAKA